MKVMPKEPTGKGRLVRRLPRALQVLTMQSKHQRSPGTEERLRACEHGVHGGAERFELGKDDAIDVSFGHCRPHSYCVVAPLTCLRGFFRRGDPQLLLDTDFM